MKAETTIRQAAQLYAMRETAQSLLGDRYQEEVRLMRQVLERVMERDRCNAIAAATRLCTPTTGERAPGLAAIVIFAAAVEMIEEEES